MRGWPALLAAIPQPAAAAQQGYLLPLASGGSLLLLLSCLSLQSLIWGQQLEGRGAWQRRQTDDLLASAAQRLALALNRSPGCLLLLPASRWPASGAVTPPCDGPVDATALLQGRLPDGAFRLVAWTPPQVTSEALGGSVSGGWGLLTLARQEPLPSVDAARAPSQRRFGLLVAGVPPRVIRVQELDR